MPRLYSMDVAPPQKTQEPAKTSEPDNDVDTAALEVCNILQCKRTAAHKPTPICTFPFQVSVPLKIQPVEQKATTVPSSPLYDDPVLSCISPPVRVNNPIIQDSRFSPFRLERELSEDPLNDSDDDDEQYGGPSDESYEEDVRNYCVARSHAMNIRPPARGPLRPSAWPRLSVTC